MTCQNEDKSRLARDTCWWHFDSITWAQHQNKTPNLWRWEQFNEKSDFEQSNWQSRKDPQKLQRLICRTNWPKHPFKLCSKPNNTMMTTTHNSLAHQEHERLASRDWEFLSRLLSFTARLIFCKWLIFSKWFIKCGSGKLMHCEASSRQKKIRMKIRG